MAIIERLRHFVRKVDFFCFSTIFNHNKQHISKLARNSMGLSRTSAFPAGSAQDHFQVQLQYKFQSKSDNSVSGRHWVKTIFCWRVYIFWGIFVCMWTDSEEKQGVFQEKYRETFFKRISSISSLRGGFFEFLIKIRMWCPSITAFWGPPRWTWAPEMDSHGLSRDPFFWCSHFFDVAHFRTTALHNTQYAEYADSHGL